MPIKLDHDLLSELGLNDLPALEANLLLRTMYETLQMRVGMVLNRRMSPAELDRFNRANALGDAESLRVLSEIAPDYTSVVAAEFEALKAEVALDVPTIRQATIEPSADHDPWRHHRPDPGPIPVITLDDWLTVVAPNASVCLALDPGGTALYARRDALPPVVLEVPDGHTIDGTWLWCDDRGEVRARFATHSDLRWRLAHVPSSPTVPYDKVLHHRRRPLDAVDLREDGDDLTAFTRGRWQIEDNHEIEVTDRVHHRSFRLEPLHEGRHWNALVPHLTPDHSQLVATYNTSDPSEQAGLKACSVGYLDAAGRAVADRLEPIPWELSIHPTATDERLAAGEAIRPIEGLGYDASSTRAVVADYAEAHLFNVRGWTRLGDIARPDQRARVVTIPLPHHPLAVAWAGRSLVVAGANHLLSRLDLQDGSAAVQPLTELLGEPVALVSWGDRTAAVCADRSVLGIDEHGVTAVTRLPGNDPLSGAAALMDGRLLAYTGAGVELYAGNRLVATTATSSPVVGLAPCAQDVGWAIAWHVDQSVSTLRIGAKALHVAPGSLPHRRDDAPPIRAVGGEMSDIDRWHLLIPEQGGEGTVGEATAMHILSPLGRVDLAATCATSMASAGLAVFATGDGIEFLPALRPSSPYPFSISLPAPARALATGRCARSVAAIGEEQLWLIRLLR